MAFGTASSVPSPYPKPLNRLTVSMLRSIRQEEVSSRRHLSAEMPLDGASSGLMLSSCNGDRLHMGTRRSVVTANDHSPGRSVSPTRTPSTPGSPSSVGSIGRTNPARTKRLGGSPRKKVNFRVPPGFSQLMPVSTKTVAPASPLAPAFRSPPAMPLLRPTKCSEEPDAYPQELDMEPDFILGVDTTFAPSASAPDRREMEGRRCDSEILSTSRSSEHPEPISVDYSPAERQLRSRLLNVISTGGPCPADEAVDAGEMGSQSGASGTRSSERGVGDAVARSTSLRRSCSPVSSKRRLRTGSGGTPRADTAWQQRRLPYSPFARSSNMDTACGISAQKRINEAHSAEENASSSTSSKTDEPRQSSSRPISRPDEAAEVADEVSGLSSMDQAELFACAMGRVVSPSQTLHPVKAEQSLQLLKQLKVLEDRYVDASAPLDDDEISLSVVRKLFHDSMPEKCVEIQGIQQVLNRRLWRQFLLTLASSKASVEATFHGTRARHVQGILHTGLQPSYCNKAVYGRGAYVATHAGTAHQYADPHGEAGWRNMFVVLVALTARAARSNCLTAGAASETAATGHGNGGNDSSGRYTARGTSRMKVTVDSMLNPTQYCVPDEARMYVSHLIRYRVASGAWESGGRVGGMVADPFQRELRAAVARAANSMNAQSPVAVAAGLSPRRRQPSPDGSVPATYAP